MKLSSFVFSLVIIIFLVAPKESFGLGLEIGPDEIYVENVVLGQPAVVSALAGEKMKLSIKNKGASACAYSINVLRCAQTTATLSQGYIDIPDTSWIFSESKEIQVPGNSAKAVELYLKIPKNKEYANKKYQAVIEVKSKKNKPEDLFVLACQLKMFFSTLNLEVEEAKNALE